jgi:hypothetical protein
MIIDGCQSHDAVSPSVFRKYESEGEPVKSKLYLIGNLMREAGVKVELFRHAGDKRGEVMGL